MRVSLFGPNLEPKVAILREGLAFRWLACPGPGFHSEIGLQKALVRDLAEKVTNRSFLEYKTVRKFLKFFLFLHFFVLGGLAEGVHAENGLRKCESS